MKRRNLIFYGLLAVAGFSVFVAADQVIFEKDSPYNHIIVKEDDEKLRYLMFEENGALQSVVKLGDPDHLELHYTRVMPVALAYVADPERVLVIGLGGGTIPTFLHKHYPRMKIDAVDIDPVVIEVAKRFFDFREDEFLRAHAADGRKFIEDSRDRYDIIFLDAFSSGDIPFQLTTLEFLQATRKILSPRGVVVGNIWSRSSNRLYDSMTRTYQEVFEELYVFDVVGRGNKVLVAVPRKGKIEKEELLRRSHEISRREGFRYDLGEAVDYGYQYMTGVLIYAPVLKDSMREPAKKESLSPR